MSPLPERTAATLAKQHGVSKNTVKRALKLEATIAARAKVNLKTSTGGTNPQPLQKSAKAEPIDTRAELAKIAGVSHE